MVSNRLGYTDLKVAMIVPKRHFVLFVLIVMAALGGCSLNPFKKPAPTPVPPDYIETKSLCNQVGQAQDCSVAVIVNSVDFDVTVNVAVGANAGILFSEQDGFVTSTDHRQILIHGLSMLPQESRLFMFPVEVDPETTLSGEYMVMATMTFLGEGEKPSELVQESQKMLVFVPVYGIPEFISTQEDFDELFVCERSTQKSEISFSVELDGSHQPTSGTFVFMIVGQDDRHVNPKLTLTVSSGIMFVAAPEVVITSSRTSVTASPGEIAPRGSRIIRFPFELNPDSFDGKYAITMVYFDGSAEVIEQLPVVLKISSSTAKSGAKWLSVEEIELPALQPSE